MSNRALIAGLAAIGTALPAGLAMADTFGHLDVNQDGIISQDEMDTDAELKAHLPEIDANHDGSISTGEFSAFEAARGNDSAIDDERSIRTDTERGKNSNRADAGFGGRQT